MKIIDQFAGQKNGYSRSITLRNRLIPVGKTQENLERMNMLENDMKRAVSYQQVKNIIDDFHRSFIQDVLKNAKFDWQPLYDQFELFQSKKDKQEKARIKPMLEKLQGGMRSGIVKKFKSDERFAKLFKKEFGISPKQYVINKRIKYASSLIIAGYHTLSEISSLCGYNDYKHFSVEFKKIVGVSPSKYIYKQAKTGCKEA